MSGVGQGPAGSCPHRRFSALRGDLRADLRRYHPTDSSRSAPDESHGLRPGLFLTPQILATLLYRLSHFLYAMGGVALAQSLAWLNLCLHKLAISPASCIGGGLFLPRPAGITFHGRAGADLTLYSQSLCSSLGPAFCGSLDQGPVLGDRVSLGARSAILGPVRVGNDVKVVFCTDLMQDVPSRCVVASRSILTHVRRGGSAPRATAGADLDG